MGTWMEIWGETCEVIKSLLILKRQVFKGHVGIYRAFLFLLNQEVSVGYISNFQLNFHWLSSKSHSPSGFGNTGLLHLSKACCHLHSEVTDAVEAAFLLYRVMGGCQPIQFSAEDLMQLNRGEHFKRAPQTNQPGREESWFHSGTERGKMYHCWGPLGLTRDPCDRTASWLSSLALIMAYDQSNLPGSLCSQCPPPDKDTIVYFKILYRSEWPAYTLWWLFCWVLTLQYFCRKY